MAYRLNKGSILILVTWALLMIGLFTAAVGYSVRQRLHVIGRLEERQELRSIAEAGVQKAIYIVNSIEDNSEQTDSLKDSWSVNSEAFQNIPVSGGSFSVSYQIGEETFYGMIDEDSKLNLNATNSAEVLARLVEKAAQVSSGDAVSIAECILDWRDSDEEEREFGAESNYYLAQKPSYRSKNGNFDVIDELSFVKGVAPDVFLKVLPYVTVVGNNKVNINTASGIVLEALGLSKLLSQKITTYRAGTDGKERTGDDRSFQKLENVIHDLDAFGILSDPEKGALENLLSDEALSIASANFSIESIAKMNYRKGLLVIRCIVARGGNVRYWHEDFYTP